MIQLTFPREITMAGRLKPACPVLALVNRRLAASYGEGTTQLPAKGSEDYVIEIPRIYPQGMPDEKPLPRVRRPESRQVQAVPHQPRQECRSSPACSVLRP